MHCKFCPRKNAGFGYIALLCTLTLISLMLSKALPDVFQQRQREKEAELLWIGEQYQKAIQAYYNQSPGSVKTLPKDISELMGDRRFFGIKRHLRQRYRDPITGSLEWGLVKDKEGGISAIYSLSTAKPIKQANFPPTLKSLEGSLRYDQWRFGVAVLK